MAGSYSYASGLQALDELGALESSEEDDEMCVRDADEATAAPDVLNVTSDMPAYGDGAEYWDAKHAKDENPYEWMQGYEDLQKLIAKCTNGDKKHRILHVGCGSSLLTEDMYDDGYRAIVNMDISSMVINRMRERNKKKRPNMDWLVMDATAMDCENGCFDLVLDKCTIDTLVCCNDSTTVVDKYLQEVVRVLKCDGVFLAFTLGDPAVRMGYLEKPHLGLQVETIRLPVPFTKSQFHFAFVCRKASKVN